MINKLALDDYINDAVRILIIASAVKKQKKRINLTEHRVRLYDYFLKFPYTMFNGIDLGDEIKTNFDEYYAFFHWKPNIVRYRQSLGFLIAKEFLYKSFVNNEVLYEISDKGSAVIGEISSIYKQRLIEISTLMINEVSKMSDLKIEEEIALKARVLARNSEVWQ